MFVFRTNPQIIFHSGGTIIGSYGQKRGKQYWGYKGMERSFWGLKTSWSEWMWWKKGGMWWKERRMWSWGF